MCCFSVASPLGWFARLFAPAPVKVSATNIFARMVAPGMQGLAYSMNLVAREPVAMILPLPVIPASGDDAVKFLDLSAHASMFEELHYLFALPPRKSRGPSLARGAKPLVVHQVGSFVASYVPTREDFTRLDPQFRMPQAAFEQLPAYADYGFAVFQLAVGKHTIHPMGLVFPTRDHANLYFPTVHVHDGRVHLRARFDHALYYQLREKAKPYVQGVTQDLTNPHYDEVAFGTPRSDYAGLADVETHVARRRLAGRRGNTDTWISL